MSHNPHMLQAPCPSRDTGQVAAYTCLPLAFDLLPAIHQEHLSTADDELLVLLSLEKLHEIEFH